MFKICSVVNLFSSKNDIASLQKLRKGKVEESVALNSGDY